VLKAMAMDPKARFQSTAEMAQAIMASGVVQTSTTGAYFGSTPSNISALGTSAPTPAQAIPTSSSPGVLGSVGHASTAAPPVTYPPGPSPQPPPAGQQRISRRALLGLGAAGAVAVAAGVYFFSRSGGQGISNKPGNAITVNFTYSTEKSAWIHAVTD